MHYSKVHTVHRCASESMFVVFGPCCVCVLMFVHSPLHASDPSLHASCAVTTRTPSILQIWISPSHPLSPLHTPPLPPCKGRWRGPETPSRFLVVPWLHRATGPQGSGAQREWMGRWVTGAAWLGSPAALWPPLRGRTCGGSSEPLGGSIEHQAASVQASWLD